MSKPTTFDEYIGQTNAKEVLKMLVKEAKMMEQPFPHTLLIGPSGIGKTILSYIIANQLETKVYETVGTSLVTNQDVIDVFIGVLAKYNQIERKSPIVLVIDEIHNISRKAAEDLLLPLSEGKIVVNSYGDKELKRLPPFTLIGATTNPGNLVTTLKSRLKKIILELYTTADIEAIISTTVDRMKIKVNKEAIHEIAKRSRSTARVAVDDYLQTMLSDMHVNGDSGITKINTDRVFSLLQIDDLGLTPTDRRYLTYLLKVERAGLANIAMALTIDEKTLVEDVEPMLVREGLVMITPGGRRPTIIAKQHLLGSDIVDL